MNAFNRYFADVLEELYRLYPRYVRYNTNTTILPNRIAKNPKYKPFKKCLGALDGVMIPASVPVEMQASWRSCKQIISQNVLAVYNYDFEFVYVLAGWEGSAHNTQVLNNARSKGFAIPHGKYFLADAGYGL
jgi:hypothetical protein